MRSLIAGTPLRSTNTSAISPSANERAGRLSATPVSHNGDQCGLSSGGTGVDREVFRGPRAERPHEIDQGVIAQHGRTLVTVTHDMVRVVRRLHASPQVLP